MAHVFAYNAMILTVEPQSRSRRFKAKNVSRCSIWGLIIIIIIIIIIQMPMIMVLSSWQSHCESSPGSFDKCRTAPSGRRPKTKPNDFGCESACSLHPPSPLLIITQPESWYSFYHHTESRRLSRPAWLVTYRDGLAAHRRSPILALTGSDVAQLG